MINKTKSSKRRKEMSGHTPCVASVKLSEINGQYLKSLDANVDISVFMNVQCLTFFTSLIQSVKPIFGCFERG